MIVEANAVKYGSAIAIPLTLSLFTVQASWIVLIIFGLILGWLARLGRLVQDRASAEKIKRDIEVSLLIGGGNGLLATIIIFGLGLNYIQGVGVAFICAFAGIKTLDTAVKWLISKLMEDYRK